jgi:hypothetical protein
MKNLKETKDILFVAWLEVVQKIHFDEHKILDQKRKLGAFYYDIESGKWNEYKKEFYTSETTRTRYAVQRLKDLLN